MIALPDLLRTQDELKGRLTHLESNSDRFMILSDGQSHLNRCIAIGESLRQWEQKALAACTSVTAMPPEHFAGPLTLLEVCKDHGYGFFHVVMQYWTTCIALFTTAWITYRSVTTCMPAGTDQPFSPWIRLPEVPAWMNPRPIAANIVTCAPHYFTDDARFWGAHNASFSMGAAMHYYAATGGQHSEEIGQLRSLCSQARLGAVTGEFLRSIANTADTAKGDCRDREEHKIMATSWYGMDVLEGRRSASSSQS